MSRPVPLVVLAGVLASGVFAPSASAQLRPLDPLDWHELDGPAFTASVGADVFVDQRASLAGTTGRLYELAAFRLAWRLDRVSLALFGTPLRVFHDRSEFAPPAQGAFPDEDGHRVDAGDVLMSTTVRLNGSDAPLETAFRFGVRLPTTNEDVGLERDQTDFFGTFGGRLRRGRVDLSGELGVGIFGSRVGVDQTDPVLYGFRAGVRLDNVMPFLALTGQHDTRENGPRRGTEDLGEVRLGVRVGQGSWVTLTAVRGLATFSPGFGLRLRFGRGF